MKGGTAAQERKAIEEVRRAAWHVFIFLGSPAARYLGVRKNWTIHHCLLDGNEILLIFQVLYSCSLRRSNQLSYIFATVNTNKLSDTLGIG